jgi:hypothetical protein
MDFHICGHQKSRDISSIVLLKPKYPQENHDETREFEVDMDHLEYKVALDNIRAHL